MSDLVDGLRGRADRYRQLWGNAAYYTEGNALFDEKAAARIEQLEAALRIAQRGLDPYATYETQLEARVVVDGICAALGERT